MNPPYFGLHRLALHIDAAAEVCALGDGHARRHDVALHRPAVADVTLLGRGDVAVDFIEDDQRLSEDLRFDLAVRAEGQHMILQLDLAFDLTFDREVLTSVLSKNPIDVVRRADSTLDARRVATFATAESRC